MDQRTPLRDATVSKLRDTSILFPNEKSFRATGSQLMDL